VVSPGFCLVLQLKNVASAAFIYSVFPPHLHPLTRSAGRFPLFIMGQLERKEMDDDPTGE
jgi:hypothetical protein